MYRINNVIYLNERELAHYNHNHDALGRFAKSNTTLISRSKSAKTTSSASGYQKQLNKLDKREAKARAKAMRSDYVADRAKFKGKKEKAVQKLAQKTAYKKEAARLNTEKKRLAKEVVAKKYDISMRDAKRNTKIPQDVLVAAFVPNPLNTVATPLGVATNIGTAHYLSNRRYQTKYGEHPRAMKGTKYRVRAKQQKWEHR